jgi:hypothetical protein
VRFAGAVSWAARARKEEEEWIRKRQWDATTLVEHKIGEEEQRRRLTVVDSGAPAK